MFEELHFGHAAERLHIAQPPLSQAIRKLEDELGVQLLVRTSRSVTPTQAGRVFAEEARGVLASFERAVFEARRAGGTRAPVRIGCVPSLPVERLLRFLTQLQEREPGLRYQVSHLLSLEQALRLNRGELEVGIAYQVEDDRKLEFEPLFAGEQVAAFLQRGHRLAAKQVLTPVDLGSERLVVFPRSSNPAGFDRWMARVEKAGYRPEALVEAGGVSARDLLVAVAETGGIAFSPSAFKEDGLMDALELETRSIDPPLSTPETVVMWHAKPSKQLRAIVKNVCEIARELRRSE